MMKLVLLSSLGTAAAFAPAGVSSTTRTSFSTASSTASTLSLRATIEKPEEETIVREAPGAGWVPEWEDRPGLPQEEFLASDMTKPDLAGMWECPLTRWDAEGCVTRDVTYSGMILF